MKIKSVPKRALFVSAALTFAAAQAGEGLTERPIKIVARTDGEAYQGYWGRCIHDLSGFTAPDGPIPLDWNHNDDEVVGVVDSIKVVGQDLIADARLTPFKPDDRASEIIHKGDAGVPYQASVLMSPSGLEIEEVAAGKTVAVNGGKFTGPGVVFRKWGLRGLAVCTYGSDSETSVLFSSDSATVDVAIIEKEPEPMTQVDLPAAGAAAAAAAAGGDGKPPVVIATNPAENPDHFSRSTAMKYKLAFGAAGMDWYVEGVSFEDAAAKFSAGLQAKLDEANAALTAKNTELATVTAERDQLKIKGGFSRGHVAPVPTQPAGAPAEQPKPKPDAFSGNPGLKAFTGLIATKLKAADPTANV